MIELVNLNIQYEVIKEDINKAIQQVLDSGSFILGKELELFENEFSDFCGAPYVIGVNTGTSALHLALLTAGVGKGDEVITIPNTFIATCEAISYTGAKPKFVDIDPETYNLDTNKLKEKIT